MDVTIYHTLSDAKPIEPPEEASYLPVDPLNTKLRASYPPRGAPLILLAAKYRIASPIAHRRFWLSTHAIHQARSGSPSTSVDAGFESIGILRIESRT